MGVRSKNDIWAMSPTMIRGECLGKLRQNRGLRRVGLWQLVALGW